MKKRIISTLMAVCLILSLLPDLVTTPAKAKEIVPLASGQTLVAGTIYKVSGSITISGGTVKILNSVVVMLSDGFIGGGGSGASGSQTRSGGYGYDSGGKGLDSDNSTVTYVGGAGGDCGSMGGGSYTSISSAPELLSTLTLNTHLTYPSNSTNTNLDGKTTAGTTSVSLYFGASALSKITVPTRTGYSFKGYFIDSNCTSTQIYKEDGTSALTNNDSTYVDTVGKWVYPNDMPLYAKWEANKYNVTLNANGGSNGVTTTFQYDVDITPQTAYKPKRVGYIFNGYYTALTGGTQVFDSNMNYKIGAGSTKLQSQFYQNTTLYAQWTPVKYTIHYYSWDPTLKTDVYVSEKKDVTYGTESPCVPVLGGFAQPQRH